jgi:hypothetical protein
MNISNSWRIKLRSLLGKDVGEEGTVVVQCFHHSNTQTKTEIEDAALAVSSVLMVVVNKGS